MKIMMWPLIAACAVSAGLAWGGPPPAPATSSYGQGAPYGPRITLAQAKRVMAAAERELQGYGATQVVAIIDSGGHIVLVETPDHAQYASIDIALGKARTALDFRRPSKDLGDAVAAGMTIMLAIPGVLPAEGGLPIIVAGKIIGAIGVSGSRPSQDTQVALAGTHALK